MNSNRPDAKPVHPGVPYQASNEVVRGPALVFAPHPDDEAFGCGGAILCHIAAGDRVTVIVVTDGGCGPDDPGERDVYVRRRRWESEQAAEVLGYGRPIFWNLPDGYLTYDETLIGRFCAAIGEHAPAVVYAPSPRELHTDHRVVAMAVAEAFRRSAPLGTRLAFYEVGTPLARPNVLLDISGVAATKRQAIDCFRSQVEQRPYHDQIAALNRYRTYTLPEHVIAAEAYRVLDSQGLRARPLGMIELLDEASDVPGLGSQAGALVSVVIRSMARETLREALASVERQTYSNIEVVVVDARGEHPPIGERCGRFPMRLVAGEGPLGRSAAANLGLDAARGEYVGFLDDDDWFFPDHVATLIGALRDAPGKRIAYSGVRCVRNGEQGYETLQVFNRAFDPVLLLAENHIPMHAALFERSLYVEGCRFDERLDTYEDWDFWIQISRRTGFVHVPRETAAYRISEGSGFGVQGDPERIQRSLTELFEKWRSLWSAEQLTELMSYARFKGAYEDAFRRLQQKDQRLAAAHAEMARLTGEVNRLRCAESELAQAWERIRALETSHSWRWTGPLRACSLATRGLQHRVSATLGRSYRGMEAAFGALRHEGAGALARRALRRLWSNGAPTARRYALPFLPARWHPLAFPEPLRPAVSIIVQGAGDWRQLFACLESVREGTHGTEYEVSIAIGAAGGQLGAMLQALHGVRLVEIDDDGDVWAAVNQAVQLARGRHLVLLRGDVVVTPGWLTSLAETFRALPDTGMACPKLVRADGRLEAAGSYRGTDGVVRTIGAGDDPERPEYNYVREMPACVPACFMVDRAGLLAAGGFAAKGGIERLCERLRVSGLIVRYQPMAAVIPLRPLSRDVGARTVAASQGDATAVPARERVLIVDRYLVTPDQDSGSLRMFNILRLLRGLSYHVTFLSERLEYVQPYISQLQGLGIEVLYRPYVASVGEHLRRAGRGYSAVVLCRADTAERHLEAVRRCCPQALLIYDTVDLHFLREQRQAELQGRRWLASLAKSRKRQELACANRADVTLVVSPVEKAMLQREAPAARVEVLSNVLEVRGGIAGFETRRDLLFVGNFHHPPNVDALRYLSGEVLPRIRQRVPDMRVHVVGSHISRSLALSRLEGVVVAGHVRDLTPYFERARVFVAPLRFGSGVKGKINLSMSYALPVVATPVAVEGMFLRDGEDVLVGADAQGFADCVVRLYRDPALWQRLSSNGLYNVKQHFSMDAGREALLRVLGKQQAAA